MNSKLKVYIISGCCGSGKTTLSRELVKIMPKTALIPGDNVYEFFQDEASTTWDERLKLTWQNILLLADNFLSNHINVIIDYVVEDEMSQILSVIKKYDVDIRYVVMNAENAVIEKRLILRNDANLVERALYLREKLTSDNGNLPYVYDNTNTLMEKQIDDIMNFKIYAG